MSDAHLSLAQARALELKETLAEREFIYQFVIRASATHLDEHNTVDNNCY